MSPKRILSAVVLLLLISTVLPAEDIPLVNWAVPPYASSGSSVGIRTMTDVTSPRTFIGVAPCRIVDTRAASAFPAGYGPPSMAGGVPRNFDLNNGPCPGLPATIDAYSLNVTVTNTAGAGFILMYPQGGAVPGVSSLNYVAGQTVANAVIVPAGTGGGVTAVAGVSGCDLIIDINGYFSSTPGNQQNFLELYNNSGGYTFFAINSSTTCGGSCGIDMTTSSGHAIVGSAIESNADENYGVYGTASSTNAFAAGIRGYAGSAAANGGFFSNAGTGNAYLATDVGGTLYSLDGDDRVRATSLIISPGTKSFAAPHPEDPGLEIRYASVEAPTVDVYFRGTGQIVNGFARIEVPDHFRFTAREGTYMTTLTPVGRSIAISVEAEGPEGIVVRGTGNARFHYVVYAERAEIEGFQPVMKNESFTPEYLGKGNRVEKLPASTRALLVRNGTLNPDGTFNTETARAQGWRIPEPPQRPERQQP